MTHNACNTKIEGQINPLYQQEWYIDVERTTVSSACTLLFPLLAIIFNSKSRDLSWPTNSNTVLLLSLHFHNTVWLFSLSHNPVWLFSLSHNTVWLFSLSHNTVWLFSLSQPSLTVFTFTQHCFTDFTFTTLFYWFLCLVDFIQSVLIRLRQTGSWVKVLKWTARCNILLFCSKAATKGNKKSLLWIWQGLLTYLKTV